MKFIVAFVLAISISASHSLWRVDPIRSTSVKDSLRRRISFLMPWTRFSRHFSASNASSAHHVEEIGHQNASQGLQVDDIQWLSERNEQDPPAGNQETRINWIPEVNSSQCLLGRMCEMDDNYPTEAIGELVRGRLNEFGAYPVADNGQDEEEMWTRKMERHANEKPLCDVRRDVKYFRVGIPSGQANFMYIVNEETYRQRIPIELCTNPGTTCSYVDSFERPVCRQKFIQLGLLAVDNQGVPQIQQFDIPITCVCYVRSPFRKRRTTTTTVKKKKKVNNKSNKTMRIG